MMSAFESLGSSPKRRESPDKATGVEEILADFPWGKAALELYVKSEVPNSSAQAEKMRTPEQSAMIKEVIDAIVRQELTNTEIFESKEKGAAFPWTVIHVGKLARTLHAKFGTAKPQSLTERLAHPLAVRTRKEFIMTSGLQTHDGHPFNWFEELLHQTMKALPEALRALEEGKTPDDIEIYTLGSPANDLGKISPEFAAQLEKDPFATIGNLYAEFAQQKMPERDVEIARERPTEITFFGVSMGASFAAKTAKNLIDRGAVTQSRKESKQNHVPHLKLNMFVPAGLNNSLLGRAQVSLGFLADGVYQSITNPAARTIIPSEKRFVVNLKRYLAGRGKPEHMDPEQKKLKNDALSKIIWSVTGGVPLDAGVKANKVVGTYDPTMFSLGRLGKARAQRREHGTNWAITPKAM